MSLDSLLFDQLAAQVTTPSQSLTRAANSDDRSVEPPVIEYLPTTFTANIEGGDRLVYKDVQVRIRIRSTRDLAYSASGTGELDDLCNLVSADLNGFTPTLTGYSVPTPLVLASEPGASSASGEQTERVLVFLFTITKGFTSVPLLGDDADASVSAFSSNIELKTWIVNPRAGTHTDMTGKSNTSVQLRATRPTADVTIRFNIIGDGATLFPAVGSRVDVTFTARSGKSFTSEVLVTAVRWDPMMDQITTPQSGVIGGAIDDATSPVFTGVIP